MPGFHKYPACWRWLQRKKQSKGHGVHSPFAFDLITNVIHSPHSFYAFSDISETLFYNKFDVDSITKHNHLSFRLVHYFQTKRILEINSGNGINTLFLMAASPKIICQCVETDEAMAEVAVRLLKQMGRRCEINPSLSDCKGERYEAIFVNLEENKIPDLNILLQLSHASTFWVFHPIKNGAGKQFWNKIVQDMRVRIAFDAKDSGIVFLRPTFYKECYFV